MNYHKVTFLLVIHVNFFHVFLVSFPSGVPSYILFGNVGEHVPVAVIKYNNS